MEPAQLQALRKEGAFDRAADAAESALAALPETAVADRLLLLLELGHSQRLRGEFRAAESAYADAMGEAELLGVDEELVDALLGLAATWRGMGRLRQAAGAVAEARELVADLEGDAATVTAVHLDWLEGGIHRFAGRLSQALDRFTDGLEQARAIGDREGEAYLLAALGGCSRTQGDYAQSEAYYRQAYTAFGALEDAFGIAYTACGRGNAARMQGQYETADAFFAEAADRYERFGDRVSYAYTLWAWGTLAKLTGAYADARRRFAAAADLFVATNDRRGHGYVTLGTIELDVLEKADGDHAGRAHAEAQALADAGYPLEAAYGELLADLIAGTDPASAQQKIAATGSNWQAEALPLNLP